MIMTLNLLIKLLGLFLKEKTWSGVGHEFCGPTKFVAGESQCFLLEVNWYWKGGVLHGVIVRAGIQGLARRYASWHMPPMID